MFVAALAHDWIEIISSEGQAGIRYSKVRWTQGCPLARDPVRAVGGTVRVRGKNSPWANDHINSFPATSGPSETGQKCFTNGSEVRDTWNKRETRWLSLCWQRISGTSSSNTGLVATPKCWYNHEAADTGAFG